jgi:hypothetical protein
MEAKITQSPMWNRLKIEAQQKEIEHLKDENKEIKEGCTRLLTSMSMDLKVEKNRNNKLKEELKEELNK